MGTVVTQNEEAVKAHIKLLSDGQRRGFVEGSARLLTRPNWKWVPVKGGETWEGNFEVRGKRCRVWLEKRPPYCDRGNWLAHIEPLEEDDGSRWQELNLEWNDFWPRYYMDLERCALEIEEWMAKRGEWVGEWPGRSR